MDFYDMLLDDGWCMYEYKYCYYISFSDTSLFDN